jgi:hypothetical protein
VSNQDIAGIGKAPIEAQRDGKGDIQQSYQFKGHEDESEDEEGSSLRRRYYKEYQQRQALATSSARVSTSGVSRAQEALSQSTISSNDSVDGYDSFENTGNKKKRKIPTSAAFGNIHSSLSAELANMGISQSREFDSISPSEGGAGPYYGSGSAAASLPAAGTGISGAGRGRYGRTGRRDASGRSPLGVSMNGSNTSHTGRLAGQHRRDFTDLGTQKGDDDLERACKWLTDEGRIAPDPVDHGIISAAIAEAAALPATHSKGQENISLLEQQSSKKSMPARTQFTFTCESDSTKGMVWPGDNAPLPGPPYCASLPAASVLQSNQNQKGFNTQGTQTSPTMIGSQSQNGIAAGNGNQQPQQPARKPKRSPGKRYAIAARERRLQQEYNNYHHPPREEDIWICEFCEYESIFGVPPEALVRQYEIKDRREQKRLAEKRRLLEKAKMKGRKGKKGNKNAKNNAATQPQPPAGQQTHHGASSGQAVVQNHGTQSDEYFGDEYDDDPIPAPPPQAPTKIPQPIGQHHSKSVRSAHVNGSLGPRDGGTVRSTQ